MVTVKSNRYDNSPNFLDLTRIFDRWGGGIQVNCRNFAQKSLKLF